MKRKHQPGCLCCDCLKLNNITLPQVTIEGYTFLEWGGSDCCKCAFFTPDSFAYTNLCDSQPFGQFIQTTDIDWVDLAYTYPQWRALCEGESLPSANEDNCCSAPVPLVSQQLDMIKGLAFYLFARIRKDSLQVCFSKQKVTCGYTTTTKWIVHLKQRFAYFSYYLKEKYDSIDHSFTLLNSCVSANPYCDGCGGSCLKKKLKDCSPPDIPLQPDDSFGGPAGFITFHRIKFYDELPTGQQITFYPEDTDLGCTWNQCEKPNDYFTELCISANSWPSNIYNTYGCPCQMGAKILCPQNLGSLKINAPQYNIIPCNPDVVYPPVFLNCESVSCPDVITYHPCCQCTTKCACPKTPENIYDDLCAPSSWSNNCNIDLAYNQMQNFQNEFSDANACQWLFDFLYKPLGQIPCSCFRLLDCLDFWPVPDGACNPACCYLKTCCGNNFCARQYLLKDECFAKSYTKWNSTFECIFRERSLCYTPANVTVSFP